MDRERLAKAYRATAYCTQLSSGELCLRVGMPSAKLDTMLTERNVEEWAFVTSDNPHSIVRPETENVENRILLENAVQTAGYDDAVVCVARSDSGDWPPEQGLCIFGITPEDALSFARRFDQHAILTGRRGEAPALVFC